MTELSLIVLRAADLERTKAFYQALGLDFAREQHGSGPGHYAAQLGTGVIEIYPGEASTAPNRKTAGATTLGFRVTALESVLEQLGAKILTPLQESPWGRRVVIEDPTGGLSS